MTITRFIGDIHGEKYALEHLIYGRPENTEQVIQVGDMGIGFGQSDYWHESIDELMRICNGCFIRGNHDNPDKCAEMYTWIPDALVKNDIMFVGGAWSIDQAWRTAGWDWWPEEELGYAECQKAIEIYDLVRPNIMVTHDGPNIATKTMFIDSGRSMFQGGLIPTRTGLTLQTMFDIHQPKLWVFGHWHETMQMKIGETTFICVGECDAVDINLEDYR